MTTKERFIRAVRKYLRDFESKNELIDGIESDDEDIELAIDAVYDHFLNAPPVKLRATLDDAIKYLWFKWGVVAHLLDSVTIMSIRNTLPYQDSGTHIDENYKAGPYANMAINLWAKFDDGLNKLKLKANLEKFSWDGTTFYNPWLTEYAYGHSTVDNNRSNRPII